MSQQVHLRAELQGMAADELLRTVDPLRLDMIKAKGDAHPEIRAYAIGHEGTHAFNLVGIGRRAITWMRDAVQGIFDRLDIGTQVFNRHAQSNSHEGRVPIGEVVGKTIQHIGDKMHTIASIYIYPNFRTMPLDVASIEADMEFESSDSGGLVPSLVQSITGIALGSSSVDSPGFPGATLLGTVQAFAQGGSGMATKAEVVAAVAELKLAPSDLFDVETILADRHVATRVKSDTKDTYEHAKRVETERDTARAEVAQVKNAYAEKERTLTAELGRFRSKDRFTALMKERKLDDRQQRFALRNFDKLAITGTDEKGVDVDINKFIDTQLAEYTELAKEFGVAQQAGQQPGGTLPVVERGTQSEQSAGTNPNDYTNPAVNDFIPKHIGVGKT